MNSIQILWADDEIDLLKPYIIFLTGKGYEVVAVKSGLDAITQCKDNNFDVVFLDENMPGISGLETLIQIKNLKPNLPVIMITKSEEEHIMEQAIGSKIADYLIKPINPNQILLSLKKTLDNKRLISENTTIEYQKEFRNLSITYNENLNHEEWADVYKKLIFWELEIQSSQNDGMKEVLEMQKVEAGKNFVKFITKNYENWLNEPKADKPLMSHQIMKNKVFPLIDDNSSTFFLLIDNLRYDQWKLIQPYFEELFNIKEESHYYSILPTTTEFARNAIFAGLMPSEIQKQYPSLWWNDQEEESHNAHEAEMFAKQLEKNKLNIKHSYHKITTTNQGKTLTDNVQNLYNNQINIMVYNFVDMLSHARTDSAMIRELAPDEAAYRSITKSWFIHSPLYDLLKKIASKKVKLVVTTDHGTIRVNNAQKIVGDRETNTNLRYKLGKNLAFDEKKLFFTRKPERFFLPKPNMSSAYVFATEDQFLAYPNNYNYYVNHYKDTFQHGGVSLEEVIIPLITMESK